MVRAKIAKLFSEKSMEEDQDIEVKKHDFFVLLLGFGHPEYALDLREKARDALRKRGFEVYMMEEIKTKSKESANAKFRRILDEYSPNLFLVLVSQNLGATGAEFELSWILQKYGDDEACKMIRICAGKRVNLEISFNIYITELNEIVIRKYDDNDFEDMINVMEDTIIDAINLRG